ncbi:hypothetical protein GCM10012280_25800 [Wenjunlia tyrosinilytica]|uniref:DUF1996 domain-containing protein n=2 Tax=Wenjunlia tyrosinilytica TaxID=1544741 RepID=A0A918DXT5_9ACTN|nr:hypothetical protein GCM10012280_25800 [Wenjunlia tyrosinilytica]
MTKTAAWVAALTLGGGGIAVVTANANAGDSSQDTAPRSGQQQKWTAGTVDCPDVGLKLPAVPRQARTEVDRNLSRLDSQVADAYQRLIASRGQGGEDFVRNSILGPLESRRTATIDRIATAIGRSGQRPSGLEASAPCTIKPVADTTGADQNQNGQNQNGQNQDGQSQGQGQQGQGQQQGPSPDDFVDITRVRPNVQKPRPGRNASKGLFISRCGRNETRHLNPDNVIVAPGVSNGAHHMHDYVGNASADGFSTNDSLAAADTTCSNGDQSAYYWPVLRLRDGRQEGDANAPGGGKDANVGKILRPATVSIFFRGSPRSKVTAMPRFLRIITGDAKSFTNGPANANASWSCTGFENRRLKDKYPLCPEDSRVVRTFNFQSCWDGQNIDSANHRTHVAFAQANGVCPRGFRAIPQLVQRITYDVDPENRRIAVDSFPEQLHKPGTDHGDFVNVISDGLMKKAVTCINSGRRCG